MQNFSHENEFDLHENGSAGETKFHKNSFVIRLLLTQRQTRTRKWAIGDITITCTLFAHCKIVFLDKKNIKNTILAKKLKYICRYYTVESLLGNHLSI